MILKLRLHKYIRAKIFKHYTCNSKFWIIDILKSTENEFIIHKEEIKLQYLLKEISVPLPELK